MALRITSGLIVRTYSVEIDQPVIVVDAIRQVVDMVRQFGKRVQNEKCVRHLFQRADELNPSHHWIANDIR